MMQDNNDISLDDLIVSDWLSVRAINICRRFQLFSLHHILSFYETHGSFKKLQNCGWKTEKELTDLCIKYNNLRKELNENIQYQDENIQNISDEELINSLTQYQKIILFRYFKHIHSNLNSRAYNNLERIYETYNPKEIFEKIFSINYSNIIFSKIKGLESFKYELIKFIKILKTVPHDKLSAEYVKLTLKTTLVNLTENLDEKIESVLDETQKIKLFSLLKLVIDNGQLFSKTQHKLFNSFYNKGNSETKIFDSVSKEVNLTKERVRQIKSDLDKNILRYFKFVSNFELDDLVNYNIDSLEDYKLIDNTFAESINANEKVNFNSLFYAKIIGIFLNKTHALLGDNEKLNEKNRATKSKQFQSCYLIRKKLFEVFNYEKFIEDINSQLNEKITETYSLQFEGYLYQFINEKKLDLLMELKPICETIILNEFGLLVNFDGYLVFERNKKKQLHEYAIEILEKNGNVMKIENISKAINEKYPDFETTGMSLRAILNREKEYFFYIGRTSTYGLKKWENENANLRGGTIRDIVEEYLKLEKEPKHISEVLEYVLKFRETNQRSVLTNIKIDESKRFKFFGRGYVGLLNKKYKTIWYEPKEDIKSWNEKFEDLIFYRKKNKNKWPSISSKDKNEQSLYLMTYRAKKSYHNGKLGKDKEELLRGIGYPLDTNIPRANDWETELNKLIEFYSLEKRWPTSNSESKNERSLYRFCYLNKKAFQKKELSLEKIEKLKSINFNLNLLK